MRKLKSALLWYLVAAFPAIAILAIRALGWMQPLEWTALDIYFQLRPIEAVDKRIVVVGFGEKDIQTLKTDPLSDELLAQVLTKIKQHKPRVIGLDIYRDVPVGEGYAQLAQVFKTTPNLIGIEKVVGDKDYPAISPPPILKQLNQVAAVDAVEDGDGVVRRALLFVNRRQTLGVTLALNYLAKQGITPETVDNCCMKIKDTVYRPLQENAGSYVRTDSDGHQILLNYRNPTQSFLRRSITDVLSGKIDNNLMRDRIVLIGRTAPSFNDKFSTPYSWNLDTTPIEIPGVEVQAQIASQIVSSALDERGIIEVTDKRLELLWIISWSVLIIFLAGRWQRTSDTENFAIKFFFKLIASSLTAAAAVVGISYLAFLWGWWIPVVPSFLALTISPLLIATYTYITKLNERQRTLEVKVAERTQQLQLNNQQLEQSMQQLKDTQHQLIIQSKLASLGRLIAGIAHEINNPLNFVINLERINTNLIAEIQSEVEKYYEQLQVKAIDEVRDNLADLKQNNLDIYDQAKRIELIIKNMMSSTHHLSLAPELVDINQLLPSIVKVVSYSLQNRYNNFNVSIKTQFDTSIEQIAIVSQEISRALTNIIDNACQAAYKNALIDPAVSPKVIVTTRNQIDNNSIEISVQDNGAGIPESIMDTIFEPFFTTKDPDEGTGLGLYLAHEIIVTRHNGQIKVESQLGIGSIFMIVLPKNVGSIS